MNRIGPVVTMAALAAFCAASAQAQAPRTYDPKVPQIQPAQRYEPAVPRGVPEQRLDPAGELGQPARAPLPPRLAQNERRTQRDADARHCLTLTNNRAVHRCAERYRSRAARARAAAVKKASAKRGEAPAPVAIEASKAPDVVKPGAPRPGDAAKAADLVKPMDVTKSSGTPRPVETATAPAKTSEPPKPPAVGPRLPKMGSAADPTAAK
ncbi:MAG TPA: hypothetical protein VD867_11775 [Burkholderiales bacterium]|nr:hypothetical protein [Burkholderiales bacterium]